MDAPATPATPEGQPSYPVNFRVEPQPDDRNKLTVAFRLILAIPHILLVGGPGPGFSLGFGLGGRGAWFGFGTTGVLGILASVCAVVSWFAIVFTGRQPRGLWDLAKFFMDWRANALAYTALLRDEYPPFSTGEEYPASFDIDGFPEERDRLSVGLRLIYAIPHILIVFALGIAWVVTAIIGWFAILFTGNYPRGLYDFAVGYMRWSVRLQAYLLLMRDEYPPFKLE